MHSVFQLMFSLQNLPSYINLIVIKHYNLESKIQSLFKGVVRKKLRGGQILQLNVTSFTYNGILPFVNYATKKIAVQN